MKEEPEPTSEERGEYAYAVGGDRDPGLQPYLAEIRRVPLLTADQEIELARRMAEGDPAAREILIKSSLRLVVALALRYRSLGVPLLDLIQDGSIGLTEAVGKFDYRRGNRLSSYAIWWIRKEILRGLSNQARTIRLPERAVENLTQVKRLGRGLYQELGRDPTPEEIAERGGLSPEKVREILESAQESMSLQMSIGEDAALGSLLEDERTPSPEDVLLCRELERELSGLDPKEGEGVQLGYGLGEQGEHDEDRVAERTGVTRERAAQIKAEVLSKWRQPLDDRSGQSSQKQIQRCRPDDHFSPDEAIQKLTTGFEADPDFLRFLLAENGLLHADVVPFDDERPSNAARERLRRRVMKASGPDRRAEWEWIKANRKEQRRVQLRRTLFALEPLTPRAAHRARDVHRWQAFFDVVNYLMSLPSATKTDMMRYAARIVFPKWTPDAVLTGWSQRKGWFVGIDGETRLDGLRRFYWTHENAMKRSIETGVPIWDTIEQMARPLAEEPCAPVPSEVFVGQCPRCGAEYGVVPFPPLADVSRMPPIINATGGLTLEVWKEGKGYAGRLSEAPWISARGRKLNRLKRKIWKALQRRVEGRVSRCDACGCEVWLRPVTPLFTGGDIVGPL